MGSILGQSSRDTQYRVVIERRLKALQYPRFPGSCRFKVPVLDLSSRGATPREQEKEGQMKTLRLALALAIGMAGFFAVPASVLPCGIVTVYPTNFATITPLSTTPRMAA